MKKIILFLVFGLFLSCKQSISESDLQNLNGYWEIEKVELPDGDKKEYKVNETIDCFYQAGGDREQFNELYQQILMDEQI